MTGLIKVVERNALQSHAAGAMGADFCADVGVKAAERFSVMLPPRPFLKFVSKEERRLAPGLHPLLLNARAAAFKPNCSIPFILEREQKSGYLLEYLFCIVPRHTKGALLCKKEPFRREKQ